MPDRQLQPDPRPVPRAMLYNEEGTHIFEGQEAIDAALEAGYQDVPLPADQLAKTEESVDNHVAEQQLAENNQLMAKMHESMQAMSEQNKTLLDKVGDLEKSATATAAELETLKAATTAAEKAPAKTKAKGDDSK